MDYLSLFIILRSIERIFLLSVAAFTIWIGYKLFLQAETAPQSATFSWENFRLNLSKVGPGIFFAMFGTILIIVLYSKTPSIQEDIVLTSGAANNISSVENKRVIRYNDTFDSNITDVVVSLNWAIQFSTEGDPNRFTSDDKESFKHGKDFFALLRNQLLIQKYGQKAVSDWMTYKDKIITNANEIPANIKEEILEINRLATRLDY